MRKFLLIGGPRHGEWHPADTDQIFVANSVVGKTLYERRQIGVATATHASRIFVYVVYGMSDADARAALMETALNVFIEQHGQTAVIQ